MRYKRAVTITPEFSSFIGPGEIDAAKLPPDPIVIGFGDMGEPAVSMLASDTGNDCAVGDHMLVFAINRAACLRMFAMVPEAAGRWYLSAGLRERGRALVAVDGESEAAGMLRVAYSLELLCWLFAALDQQHMVEYRGDTSLSEVDVRRVAAAHRLVSENWQERLTVGEVARRSGLNKAKLTRGFRELYQCTVAEAVAEQRLASARSLLELSDLPVSSIGYRCGYTSNASFTRAFTRRFGMAPTEMRRRGRALGGAIAE